MPTSPRLSSPGSLLGSRCKLQGLFVRFTLIHHKLLKCKRSKVEFIISLLPSHLGSSPSVLGNVPMMYSDSQLHLVLSSVSHSIVCQAKLKHRPHIHPHLSVSTESLSSVYLNHSHTPLPPGKTSCF